ncbi:protein Bouncer-like [Hypomesus transpacificus]|uniref:protein Bouncer-like n=1 Tax=Hypomesus transpacificus TaxID=137520 RepID=UPI001F076FD3|nr:protein Bouncer-like [Hypomesus transpacificus]
MESQGKQSVPSAQPLSPFILIQCVLLASLFFMPGMARNRLLCNFSALQFKDKAFLNVTTECLPHQSCYTSRGRRGSEHMVSAQGCIASTRCGTFLPVSYRGLTYNASYTCCCRERCNQPPSPDTQLRRLLGLTKDPTPNSLDACPTPATL